MRQLWRNSLFAMLLLACLCQMALAAEAGEEMPAAIAEEAVQAEPVESPAPADAALYGEVLDSGTWGINWMDQATEWTLYTDGRLIISGAYTMPGFGSEGAPWYRNRTKITSVEIADGVQSIGSYCFEDCSNLVSVTIPGSVTQIGNSAFSGCTSLKEIAIPNTVTSIDHYAFSGCLSLAEITIPGSVTSIGLWAFRDCTSLTKIAIPDSVTSIGNYAFQGCTSLTEAILPDNIWKIPDSLFSYCTSLRTVNIPNSVTEIGSSAFCNCTSLTNVVIGTGVTSIGENAFYQWNSTENIKLTNVEFLGNAPDTVGNQAFPSTGAGRFVIYYHSGTSGWTTPTWNGYPTACIDAQVDEYSVLDANNRNAQGILFTLNESSMTATVGTGALDTSSQSLNNAGYSGAGGGHVVIPAAVTKDGRSYRVTAVGQNAFSGNNFLRSLELGENVRSISGAAFRSCPNFAEITVSGGSYYSASDGVLYDKSQLNLYVYPAGKTASSFAVPSSVRTVSSFAFSGAVNLREVVVPDTVTAIMQSAFERCIGLEKITLPFIGDSVDSTQPFSYIFVPLDYYDRYEKLDTVVVTGGKLNYGAFSGYDLQLTGNIKRITLPAGVTEIPGDCFRSCPNLETLSSVDVVPEPGDLLIPESVTQIGYNAFQGCTKFNKVAIPAGVTSIGNSAFAHCSGIKEFSVAPENEAYCSDKWGVLFTKDLSRLIAYPSSREWPYYNIPDATTAIESGAFYQCRNLTNLYIPKSTQNFGGYCFSECPKLTVCTYVDSPAARYASANNLVAWYMDNYTLQGLEIVNLPERVEENAQLMLDDLYVVADYGGQKLQLEDYSCTASNGAGGKQTVTIVSEEIIESIDVQLFDGNQAQLVTFDSTPEPVDSRTAYAAVYSGEGKMLLLCLVAVTGGEVHLVVDAEIYRDMGTAKLFVMEQGTFVPVLDAAVSVRPRENR